MCYAYVHNISVMYCVKYYVKYYVKYCVMCCVIRVERLWLLL